jgi:acetyltransferase-like isoleucine patch superfamily enzyme
MTKFILRLIRLKRILIYIIVPVYFKLFGAKIGKRFRISSFPIIFRKNGAKIELGNNISINNTAYENLAGANNKTMLVASKPESQIIIGNFVGLSSVVINAKKSVVIEDFVQIGINTRIYDNDFHDLDPLQRKYECTKNDRYLANVECEPIVIKQNVWIGANCLILKGVTIGENSVIGAGSIVTKDIPANVIAVGNPAKIIKNLNDSLGESSE